ncbi:hypothetical protein [Micromonospora noduli]|uniref:hypothetical protein n=1 Tax=Micromonospora noduli TaxID=709876 RepID=UPI0011BDE365|nr:hypothetical protein [Micromonospora noduli]
MRLHAGETEAVGWHLVTLSDEHATNWLREELPFMLRERPWSRATLIVAGPPEIDHNPDTELVIAPPISL